MKRHFAGFAMLAAVACAPSPDAPQDTGEAAPVTDTESAASEPNVVGTIPAGAYTLDPTHASLTFEVSHLGFSSYTASFDQLEVEMALDPANVAAAQIEAKVQLSSLDLPSPPEGFLSELLGPGWLNAGEHPFAAFHSTSVELTGNYTAHVIGDLTLNGVTAPVAFDVVFNGGWEGIPPDPHARIGFSAHGAFNRSDFGVDQGLPPPGTSMGVSDAVSFQIEAEFVGPEWTPPAEQ